MILTFMFSIMSESAHRSNGADCSGKAATPKLAKGNCRKTQLAGELDHPVK